MQRYVDEIERVPVLVLPCLVRYRDPDPSEGASVYPACQNLLLAARGAGLLRMAMSPDGAAEIARRSRGTPRIASRLLRRVRDFAAAEGATTGAATAARAARNKARIDPEL